MMENDGTDRQSPNEAPATDKLAAAAKARDLANLASRLLMLSEAEHAALVALLDAPPAPSERVRARYRRAPVWPD